MGGSVTDSVGLGARLLTAISGGSSAPECRDAIAEIPPQLAFMANPYKDMHISKYAGFADTSKSPGFAPAFSCESGSTLSNEGSFPRQSRARRAAFRAEFDLAPPRIPSPASRAKGVLASPSLENFERDSLPEQQTLSEKRHLC
jgi:hypothetical protein